ncbi:hypothetical protein LWF01_15810 [Saxibacter everestensis]|uniref:Apea-like HEPN domain-containing protein n=1 Tax=Saxibacter everestensis TaxID=2909229 RepID=A0ABY8QRI9_9MICO|nr:hypothetical protein LWF01_15810 [Brevibacteriaceae bacterium ZFBP1038]
MRALLEDRWNVGEIVIEQTMQQLRLQYTDISHVPGECPSMYKVMRREWTKPNQFLTVVQVPLVFPATEPPADCFAAARRRARSAVALVAASLDERIVDRFLGEVATVELSTGQVVDIDVAMGVRDFDTTLESETSPRAVLESLAQMNLREDPVLAAALRWYLAALDLRVTAAGFVLLCTACEALVDPLPKKNKSFNSNALERALNGTGSSFSTSEIATVVRARARLVHHGEEDHEDLFPAWYALEAITRTLLMHRSEVEPGWPARVRFASDGSYKEYIARDYQSPPVKLRLKALLSWGRRRRR